VRKKGTLKISTGLTFKFKLVEGARELSAERPIPPGSAHRKLIDGVFQANSELRRVVIMDGHCGDTRIRVAGSLSYRHEG